ncbi:quinone oxidoreductase family protein [Yinghuangia seranimata]|uniref:quinone oxidoreductase family protein n=1 Tax=Yinghuangia seranimata TaxID=408067 RepID=UPI00248B6041|nr:zinc-binding dehydrogenase [Yinghuangia seranimata]MDI2125214.1 zinc-binding dehydrogenase [Yinghuangia seranimata]
MRAAVLDSFGAVPRYGSFADPTPAPGLRVVRVEAAGLHPVVRALAGGGHYGSGGELPQIPGLDGVGRLDDGTRVYFGFAQAPYGSMAELSLAADGWMCPVPDGLDPAVAAGLANPGFAAHLALHWRGRVAPGETVLVLGATGVSGRLAVQLALRAGAGRVIAAGRDPEALELARELGAHATVRLGSADDAAAIVAAADGDLHVIVDYVWGAPAEAAIAAVRRTGMSRTAPDVRLVQVGQKAGPTVALPADVLRGSGLTISGTGGGTTPPDLMLDAIQNVFALAADGSLRFDVERAPLADVAEVWKTDRSGLRTVLTP